MTRNRRSLMLEPTPFTPDPNAAYHVRKTKQVNDNVTQTVERKRVGDRMLISETNTSDIPAEIPWRDIVAGARIEPDDVHPPPWDDDDGWSHEVDTDICDLYKSINQARGYVPNRNYGNGQRSLLRITDKSYGGDSVENRVLYLRNRGASKQVAREVVARDNQQYINQLTDWYENGWNYWYVTVSFIVGGKIYDDSLGGIDDHDYATEDIVPELCGQIAYALEQDGFTVTGKPGETEEEKKQYKLAIKRAQLCRHLNMFNWK